MNDLLRVEDLHVRFATPGGFLEAIKGVSFRIPPAATVALVGESGSGKSVVSQSILRILPRNGEITRGAVERLLNSQLPRELNCTAADLLRATVDTVLYGAIRPDSDKEADT